ncbi:hypothetical protein ALC57_18298, partial [Trachymyrmex cornetzi]
SPIPKEHRRLCDTASKSEFERDQSCQRGTADRYRNQCQRKKNLSANMARMQSVRRYIALHNEPRAPGMKIKSRGCTLGDGKRAKRMKRKGKEERKNVQTFVSAAIRSKVRRYDSKTEAERDKKSALYGSPRSPELARASQEIKQNDRPTDLLVVVQGSRPSGRATWGAPGDPSCPSVTAYLASWIENDLRVMDGLGATRRNPDFAYPC